MKKALLTTLIALFALSTNAQDTIVVQTLDFNDITKRRGWYVFPSDTNEYQKILMYYTLKCDAQTTQDQYACGEWDYTTYTRLYQHENIGASRYNVNGSYVDSFPYFTGPTYTYYQNQQYFIVYDAVTSQNDYTMGSGSTPITHTFDDTHQNGKAQYLWRASELTAAGLTAGSIDKIKLDLSSLGADLDFLTVKMKNTTLTDITPANYETSGLTEVYNMNTIFTTTGVDSLNLTTPFVWDGSSNIVLEFCFSNKSTGAGHTLVGETTAYNSAVYTTEDDGVINMKWGNFVEIPASAFNNIDSAITISFWCYGDTASQPQSNYTFEGLDSNNRRVVNAHLPWSNSQVYWDAGNSGGSSYDRINQTAASSSYEGQWNHWAFTKDVSTGEMKVYLNGSLWHSGTGKTKTMDGIAKFRIGGRPNDMGGRYDGMINDFRIWNTALDSTTIQTWMNHDVNPSHPNYANLQANYSFDDMTGNTTLDISGNGHTATMMGLPQWKYIKGCDQYRNLQSAMERPNISFTQGVYTTHIDSNMVLDSIMNPSITIIEDSTYMDFLGSGIAYAALDTIIGWYPGTMYTYDQYNNIVDSVVVAADALAYSGSNYSQDIFQIQNYVTPYGIGLSLGPDGFRWVYDVTDYRPLLHDTINLSAGNQQELIDLKFIMIKGTPPRDVLKVETIERGDYQHAALANDLVCQAKTIALDPAAASFRIKTRTSGHWFGGPQNCAEFCPRDHNVFVDGVKRFEWNNFTECADNPVIAQGGTWIYDRAGWCPGAFTDTYNHELTPYVTPGTNVVLDYGMELNTGSGGTEGNYRMTMQLVTYGANNFNLDARIDEILSPTNWEYRSKYNPICIDPEIVIQNTGTTTLTSLTITYNVLGGTPEVYNWTGSLGFMEKEKVTLPISTQSFWTTSATKNEFEVTISAPNGSTDEYPDNNSASSTFEKPEVYGGKFILKITTNLAGYENSYTIKDDQGNILMQRTTMANSTSYNDTVDLPDGCYVFELLDSDDDGMSFFANNDGSGSVRFWYVPPTPVFIKTFNAQFGKFIKHHFIVDHTLGIETYNKLQTIEVYPNPSHDVFNINLTGFEKKNVSLTICNAIGENIYGEVVNPTNGAISKQIDLAAFPNGIYYVRVFAGNDYAVKKIIKN